MAEPAVRTVGREILALAIARPMVMDGPATRKGFEALRNDPAISAIVRDDAPAMGHDTIMAKHPAKAHGDHITGPVIESGIHRKTINRVRPHVKMASARLPRDYRNSRSVCMKRSNRSWCSQ